MHHATSIVRALGLTGLSVFLLAGCQDPKPDLRANIDAGNRYFWRAQYAEAIREYQSALNRDRSDAEVLYKLGQCYDRQGDYREAVFYYRQAVKSRGAFPEAARALEADERRLGGQPDPGLDQMSPRKRAASMVSTAKTYEDQKLPDKALENFRRAVEIAPDFAYPHAELGRYYRRVGRKTDAVGELQQAFQLNRNEPGVAGDLAALGVK
jgi:tetratricopeptide (TPR) repeat protein